MARKRTERTGRRRPSKAVVQPLPTKLQAPFDQLLSILLGHVPLPEMTQEETDWLFEQKMLIGGDD